MVDPRMIIDTTFLFDKTHKAFLGVEILSRDGVDVTYTFGLIRDVLRLLQTLQISKGLLVIGKEACGAVPLEKVEPIVTFLEDLGLPLIYEAKISALDIGYSLATKMTHVLSHNKSFLQLASGSFRVLLPNGSNEYVEVTANDVKSYLGVSIGDVPTFLTLTQGLKVTQMTKKQAIRLIELHGNLDLCLPKT